MQRFWFGQVLENGMFLVWPNLSASQKKKRNVSGYLCTSRENGMFLVTCVQALAEKMECFWLHLCKRRKWNVSGWPNLSASTKKCNVTGYLCTSRENGTFLVGLTFLQAPKNVTLLATCVQAEKMERFWLG